MTDNPHTVYPAISYLIRASDQVFDAVAPAEKWFSYEEMTILLGGPPDLLCKSKDGYWVFAAKNRAAKTNLINVKASAMYSEIIVGNVLLCHVVHKDD